VEAAVDIARLPQFFSSRSACLALWRVWVVAFRVAFANSAIAAVNKEFAPLVLGDFAPSIDSFRLGPVN
jgi:hypothetical protein